MFINSSRLFLRNQQWTEELQTIFAFNASNTSSSGNDVSEMLHKTNNANSLTKLSKAIGQRQAQDKLNGSAAANNENDRTECCH